MKAILSQSFKLIGILALAVALCPTVANAECQEGEYVCVDGPGYKYIEGVEVWRECWNYQFQKECGEEEQVDYCTALWNEPQCTAGGPECQVFDLSGKCIQETTTFTCTTPIEKTEGVIELDRTYTIASSTDTSECKSFMDNTECYVAKTTCVEPAGIRIINGVSINKESWREAREYDCLAPCLSNSCQTLDAASECTAISDPVCANETESGCQSYSVNYRCVNSGEIEGEDIWEDTSNTSPGFDTLSCQNATAGMTCNQLSFSCTEEGGTKTIDGQEITADCWERTIEYSCRETVDEMNCDALSNTEECTQQSSTCIDKEGFKCYAYQKEYLCVGSNQLEFDNVDKLEENTVIGDIEWSSECSSLELNANCSAASTVCVEEGGYKEINGEQVYKDCWKYETKYICSNQSGKTNDCDELQANPKCVLAETSCLMQDDSGQCITTAFTYRCEERAESQETEVICREVSCLDGLCTGTDEADKDLSWVMAILETAREGSVYADIDGAEIFKGSLNKCSKKILGFSCCGSKVKSGSSNSEAFGKILTFTGDTTIEVIKYLGSPYVYDALSASDATSGLLTMLYGNATSGIYNPTLSFYGFSMTLQSGTMYFTFNPAAFALSVAVQIAMEYFQCDQDEQALMLKKGQNLCHYVGTYCSKGE
ncbi:MAG: conjugal transfer protein TraN, partial [Burkholderiales bacterium]|nr:conjugal transfer protein TraN [Burkholderiales bacterium]